MLRDNTRKPQTYLPTREQIAKDCERIQRKWTAKQREERLVTTPTPWTVPLSSVEDLPEDVDE